MKQKEKVNVEVVVCFVAYSRCLMTLLSMVILSIQKTFSW